MTTGTQGTKVKSLETHNTHKHTQTHTGKLDVHKCETVCLMPVFFRPGMQKRGSMEEKERRGGGGGGWRQVEDESRRRATPIKNDSRWRTRHGTERKKTDYAGRGKRLGKKSSLEEWRSWRKNTERSTRLADKESWGGSLKNIHAYSLLVVEMQ